MPIARRQLLGLGAAVAVSAAASSCRGSTEHRAGASPRPSATAAPASPPPTVTVTAAPFEGRPPPGHLYFGASLPHFRSLPAWERTLGTTLALNRSYFTPERNETAQLVQQCRDDLAHARLPHVSAKAPGTWSDVASGVHDDWLRGMIDGLGAEDAPVFLTLHHEPENDAGAPGMQAADYVGMQRRAIGLAADRAPQVTVVPVLQHWTFDPLHVGATPAAWIVHEAAVLGIDVYNPWSPTNGKTWRSMGSRVDEVLSWYGDTPVAIGEYGCREDPANPGIAATWLRDAADYARTHTIVSMSYFNSGLNSPDGSVELEGETEQVFAELLDSPWVARPV